MSTSSKYLGYALLAVAILLPGCQSSILHKDGMREALTEPLIESLESQVDKLNIGELIESTNKAVDSLSQLMEEVKQSAEVSQETLKAITTNIEHFGDLAKQIKAVAESSSGLIDGVAVNLEKFKDIQDSSKALIDSAKLSIDESQKIIPEVAKIAAGVNEIIPEVKNIVVNLNSTLSEIKKSVENNTTDSIWWKLLPALALVIAVMLGALLVVRAVKKGKDESKS